MAETTKTIITSDVSNKEVPEAEAAKVRIDFRDKVNKRYYVEIDVAESEIPAEWLKLQKPMRGAAPGTKRGPRKPKAASEDGTS